MLGRWTIDATLLAEMADLSLHWQNLREGLPPEGVGRRFPTENDCFYRLAEVRWPEGPECPRCRFRDMTWIVSRELCQCRRCRHQFSVTSGTILHRSRLPVRFWFLATQQIIRARLDAPGRSALTSNELAQSLGVGYVAAHRMRRIIVTDIGPGGQGLLSSAVCVHWPTTDARQRDQRTED